MDSTARLRSMMLARASGATLGEIATEWSITKERVRQILAMPSQDPEVERESVELGARTQSVLLRARASVAPRCSCPSPLVYRDDEFDHCARCGRLV